MGLGEERAGCEGKVNFPQPLELEPLQLPKPPPQPLELEPLQLPKPPPQPLELEPLQLPKPPPQPLELEPLQLPKPPPQPLELEPLQLPKPPPQPLELEPLQLPKPPPQPLDSNFPYRRYDRLPPISQFSIESDSDLSETAELIEEYEVFDPSRPRPKVILVIGGPGSGKGTQSLKIAERYGFQYVSVGELLRRKMIHNATSNRKVTLALGTFETERDKEIAETTITEIKQKIMKIPDATGIVIDGFPRDVGQALSFEDQICTPDLVVFLACANHRLKERLEKRAEQQGRPDDNPKATERRLTNFKQNTIPLVKYFQERGPIVTLDADRDEEEVFSDISMTLDNNFFPSKSPVA
ncbi:hypothetical protein CRUP_028453, partial [Coryphaenoides rupestris]